MTSPLKSRRGFITRTATGLVLAVGPLGPFARMAAAQTQGQPAPPPAGQVPPRPPALAPSLVQEFVKKAHADFPGTKALLAEQPSLLNATWDWGGGDFEMGIGGAGHMGHREIAEYLIGQGARLDIFVAAMLGRLEIVQALLTAWPTLIDSRGPHGISLLRHARAGGDLARAVADYLSSRGAK